VLTDCEEGGPASLCSLVTGHGPGGGTSILRRAVPAWRVPVVQGGGGGGGGGDGGGGGVEPQVAPGGTLDCRHFPRRARVVFIVRTRQRAFLQPFSRHPQIVPLLRRGHFVTFRQLPAFLWEVVRAARGKVLVAICPQIVAGKALIF
jgi:hypothetical protein